jgi:hypothetical protein
MGFSVATTVLARAATLDLVSLDMAKTELELGSRDTGKDPWLALAIKQVSGAVRTHCNRVFMPELVCDQFDIQQDAYPYQTPGGFAQLQLSRWPVIGGVSVVQTLATGASPSTQLLVEGKDYRLDAQAGLLLRLNPWTGTGTNWEAIPVMVTYAGGYGALSVEGHVVPDSAPYQITIDAAGWACDIGVVYADGTPLTRASGLPGAGQYAVSNRVYTFAAADAGQSLALSFATAEVPDDLAATCLRLITARYKSRGRDPNLIQRETPGVGVERWWFGGAPGQKGRFTPDIEAELADYRVETIA